MEIETLHQETIEYPPDSIEWCPHPAFLEYFACGMYHLDEEKTKATSVYHRQGCIILYKYEKESNVLIRVSRVDTAAILDMKWMCASESDKPHLVAANGLGEVELYVLDNDNLVKITSISLGDESAELLTLSVDIQLQPSKRILASDSKGGITLLDLNESSIVKNFSWKPHSFEAWTCAFDKWNNDVVYTGGDDCIFHSFSLQSGCASKLIQNSSHIAGVTNILSHPKKEHLMLTGSYDENVRMFDTRQLKNEIRSIDLKGGIWRLKPNPKHSNHILCACMYHNFSIIEFTDDLNSLELKAEFNQHKSICYGADWCQSMTDKDYLVMATCSFYDKVLCISSLKGENL